MAGNGQLSLRLRTQRLTQNENGYTVWCTDVTDAEWPVAESALLLCDVWDKHWSRGATERLNLMIPRMNAVAEAARAKGVQIVHAPSNTMDFYADTPARQRMLDAPHVDPPAEKDLPDRPLPVDASDHGSDTGETQPHQAWVQQHPGIRIDQERDGMSESGQEVYRFLRQRGITNMLTMGVHTNMCVLGRSFAIKQMIRWGVSVALVRDLTDTMYNPAMPPYVSHEEGTRLVVEYIEKFWCPTVLSEDVLDGE